MEKPKQCPLKLESSWTRTPDDPTFFLVPKSWMFVKRPNVRGQRKHGLCPLTIKYKNQSTEQCCRDGYCCKCKNLLENYVTQ